MTVLPLNQRFIRAPNADVQGFFRSIGEHFRGRSFRQEGKLLDSGFHEVSLEPNAADRERRTVSLPFALECFPSTRQQRFIAGDTSAELKRQSAHH